MFFLDTDVIALPEPLGQQVGAAALRDQDATVLGVLLDTADKLVLPAESLADEVQRLAKRMQDAVIVYNGQSELEELLSLEFDDEDGVTLAGLPAFALYIGGSELLQDLLLVDRSTVPSFKLTAEEKPGLTPIPGADLALGIEPQSATHADPGAVTGTGSEVGATAETDEPVTQDGGSTTGSSSDSPTNNETGAPEPMMIIEYGQILTFADVTPVATLIQLQRPIEPQCEEPTVKAPTAS